MEKEPGNRINRAANIAIAHGCWIGSPRIYRDHGIPRLPKEKQPKPVSWGDNF